MPQTRRKTAAPMRHPCGTRTAPLRHPCAPLGAPAMGDTWCMASSTRASEPQSTAPGPGPAPEGREERQARVPTLGSLLAAGAGEALELVCAPRGRDVPVRGVGVFDSGETFAAQGQVLVAAGVDDSSDVAPMVLRSAARAGAVAVVTRRGAGGPGRRLLELAEETGTALLTRAPWIEWTELIGMLRAALAHRGGPAGPEAATDVPLGDLPALARALAELVGGAVTIEDPDSRVLAYSPTENGADPLRRLTILGGQVPRWRLDELAASGFLRTLWASDDVVHRPAEERFSERLAIAVRAGEEVLGSIWAAADGRPLPPDARQALREAARTAAPHLLHHRLRHQTGATRRRQAVRALLEGAGDARSAAATLGLALGTPCVVLAVTTDAVHGEGTAHDRALRLASLQVSAHQPPGFALRTDDRLDVLLPLPDGREERSHGPRLPADATGSAAAEGAGESGTEGTAPQARRLALQLAAAVREAGVGPLVAIGAARPGLTRAGESREVAHLVLQVLRERRTRAAPEGRTAAPPPDGHPAGPPREGGPGTAAPAPEVADENDVREALDALRVVRAVAGLTPQVDGPVRDLLAHDAEHRSDLAPTLAAYLSRFGDVASTARQLGVHPNTLRYRLRRLRTRFGLDLDDPDVRLLAELGLRAAGLYPAPGGGPGHPAEPF